jgi:hypothetical protein
MTDFRFLYRIHKGATTSSSTRRILLVRVFGHGTSDSFYGSFIKLDFNCSNSSVALVFSWISEISGDQF